jgi:hypothetical protein
VADLRIGTSLIEGRWTGVLREGRKVVLTCGCGHHNRDESSRRNGRSARDCITALLKAARYPEYAAHVESGIRGSAESYLRSWGTTSGQAARMRQAAAEAAEAFSARLPEVAALIGDRPVYGYTDHITVASEKASA